MKILYAMFLWVNLLFGYSMQDFDQFDMADQNDHKEFIALKKNVISCLKDDNIQCARKELLKMKNYITSKHDVIEIKTLEKMIAKHRQKKRTIAIKDCGIGNEEICTLFIDGKFQGTIAYHYKNDDGTFFINIHAKGVGANAGYYNPHLESTYTVNCGFSNDGSAKTIIDSLYQFAQCYINGSY